MVIVILKYSMERGKATFLDFDDAITGPAIQDLWMLLSGEKENRQKQFSEILEGYENFYYFDSSELALIEHSGF